MSYRVHFIHAPDPVYQARQNFGNAYTPLWAMVIAPFIEDRASITYDLFDTRICSEDEIGEADAFLFSALNQDLDYMRGVAERLKARYPKAKFAIGGPITWSFDQAGWLNEFTPFDYICIGDGELIINRLLDAVRGKSEEDRVIRAPQRFNMGGSMPMDQALLKKYVHHYYGTLLEVSRGCPFLCEFCDIRILTDNNRAHNKDPDVIIEDLDRLANLGVKSFMLCCDNFIGEPRWAHEVADKMIEWRERTGHRPSFFTWLTINLAQDPALMVKLRQAGFDVLFIGVESFDTNTLLEMSKVQNRSKKFDLPEALRQIQSYGFIVTPGLIFGFDSDTPEIFDKSLEGMEESCLLTSNPGLLVALPGTPLYRRMKLSGRLRPLAAHIGRFKFQTNIRYLLPTETLIKGYVHFMKSSADGRHQYRRLRNYVENLETGNFIAQEGAGYGSLAELLRNVIRNRLVLASLSLRMGRFLLHPMRVYFVTKGLLLLLSRRKRIQNVGKLFSIWLYGWSNMVIQSGNMKPTDFDIESVQGEITGEMILPAGYENNGEEEIPETKKAAQIRATTQQLRRLVKDLPPGQSKTPEQVATDSAA
ncbi:MAG: B12-binding domain-containing radical SAM protein [Rhodospirillaceae bacterium]